MADTNLVYPYEFEGGKKAIASEVNANFEAVKVFANGINATLTNIQSAIKDLKSKPTREMLDVYYSFSAETPIGAYPLWTGETITNCKSLYPDFWKKINQLADKQMVPMVNSDEYEEKLKKYGQCASFFIDTLNGHIRLPKITKFISSISDLTELAKEENSGLPNIKGDGYWNFLNPISSSGDSAIYSDNGASSHINHTNGSDHRNTSRFLFDASRHNSIYGASNDVQPPSVKLCLYLQVANNVGEISALDVNVIIGQMNMALEALQVAYEKYSTDLEDLYKKVREDILNSSPIIKMENVEVSAECFVADDTYSDYPYKADIPVNDALEDNIPMVVFSLEQIESGNYAPVALSGNGYVRIYAKEVPEDFVIQSILLQ